MKTVKVLHIISGLETGGAEMALYRLLKYMSRSKVQSAVVCLGKSGFIGQQSEESSRQASAKYRGDAEYAGRDEGHSRDRR